nr:hypothetical protein [Tanacetum cinerariifolium]
MAHIFADTHNMITHLTKSDASEGFDQILDFLNASVINYALMVNPTIYVSCIKQFWSSVSVKKVNDVVHDVESIDNLPNEEIFIELAWMGYEKPSTKLTFYKAADDVANVAADDVDDVVAKDVAEPTPPSPTPTKPPPPPPQELPSTSQVAPTLPPSPIAPPSSPPKQQQPLQPSHNAAISMDLLNTLLETCITLTKKVKALEHDKVAQALEITKLKQQIRKLERKNKLKVSGYSWEARRVSSLRGIIVDLDADKDVTLEDVVVEVDTAKDAKVTEDADIQGRLEDVTRRRKGVVIRDPAKTATPSTIVHSEQKSKDKGKDILVEDPKPLKKQAQIEQDEAYARDFEIPSIEDETTNRSPGQKEYDGISKNMAGFKMDFFRGMSYDDIRPIFEKYFNSNVAFLEKSEKELDEEASRALKRKTKSSEKKAAK